MSDRNIARLVQWLVRLGGDGGGRVSLGHLGPSGPGVPLGQWAVRADDTREAKRQLAESIVGAATDDTDGQIGSMPQQYIVLFYTDAEPDKRASRFPFYVASAEPFAPEGGNLATEPPTDRGLLSQTLRHNELLLKTSFGALGSAASQLERHNHLLSTQLERVTEQVFEMQRERQDLLDREAERMLEHDKFEAERDHKSRMTSELLSVGKGVLATLSNGGKPLMLPVSTSTASAGAERGAAAGATASAPAPVEVPAAAMMGLSQLQELLRSLTPEQVQTVLGALSPTQQASMMCLYQLFAGLEEDAGASVDAAEEASTEGSEA